MELTPNCCNTYNYTPLHWAAKHGHVQSAQILMQHKADPNALNDNQDLPLDLALRHGQDEIVHLFLGTTQRLKKPEGPPPKDILKSYQDCLMEARASQLIEEQIFYLEKMSDYYIQNKNFVPAALILNAALAFLKTHKNNPLFEKYLLSRIERIEGMFLEIRRDQKPLHSTKKTAVPGIKQIYAAKNSKPSARIAILKTEGFSPALLQNLTTQFRSMLSNLILDAQTLLGPSPCQVELPRPRIDVSRRDVPLLRH